MRRWLVGAVLLVTGACASSAQTPAAAARLTSMVGVDDVSFLYPIPTEVVADRIVASSFQRGPPRPSRPLCRARTFASAAHAFIAHLKEHGVGALVKAFRR